MQLPRLMTQIFLVSKCWYLAEKVPKPSSDRRSWGRTDIPVFQIIPDILDNSYWFHVKVLVVAWDLLVWVFMYFIFVSVSCIFLQHQLLMHKFKYCVGFKTAIYKVKGIHKQVLKILVTKFASFFKLLCIVH